MAVYKNAYEVVSPNHESLMKLVRDTCRENDILFDMDQVWSYLREFDQTSQQLTFDDFLVK